MAGDPLRDAFRAQLVTVCTDIGVAEPWLVEDLVNTDADPDDSVPFISLEFPGGAESQFTTGAPGYNLFQENGQVTVVLHMPLAEHQAEAERHAAGIRTRFRNRRFTTSAGRQVRITETHPMGGGFDDSGLWIESVALGYETFNEG